MMMGRRWFYDTLQALDRPLSGERDLPNAQSWNGYVEQGIGIVPATRCRSPIGLEAGASSAGFIFGAARRVSVLD